MTPKQKNKKEGCIWLITALFLLVGQCLVLLVLHLHQDTQVVLSTIYNIAILTCVALAFNYWFKE